MFQKRILWRQMVLAGAVVLIGTAPGAPQSKPGSGAATPSPPAPRLEPVADTRLLMEGLNQANFQGLEKLLQRRPDGVDAWTFARGQALLIAETGNLLLLRPPRNTGRTAWMERAVELRSTATRLARAAAARDYAQCRTGLADLATTCNRCHQSFRVQVRIEAFAESAQPVP
jgi:hypothetical protein